VCRGFVPGPWLPVANGVQRPDLWCAAMRNWRLNPDAKPLGNTLTKAGQGEYGLADFPAGTYPACSVHGAMNKVAPAPLWRCLACNIGCELGSSGPTCGVQRGAL
jgi:hypothetical protein